MEARNCALAEKQHADTESATAAAVSDFLQHDILAQANASEQARPGTKPDPDLKVRNALDRAAARIAGKFDRQPLVEASIRQMMGDRTGNWVCFRRRNDSWRAPSRCSAVFLENRTPTLWRRWML
jgi:hypothetical protein